MTDMDGYGEVESRGARGQSTRNWTTSSLAWTAKRGGKALGYSLRALRETGTLITGAQRATTQTIKASGRAADALFASAAGQLPLQIPIGTRIRKKKRIRRLQKQSAHLRQKMGLKIAAGLDAEDTDSTEDVTVTVRNLAQALRVRAVEIAELRSKLELSRTGTEARAASERIKRKAQPVPEKPTAAQESMVMAGGPRKESTRTETARTEAVADEEPAVKALPAGEPSVDTPIAEAPEPGEPSVDTPIAEAPEPGEPSVDTPIAEAPEPGEPNVDRPTAEPPESGEPNVDRPTAEAPEPGEPNVDRPIAEAPEPEEPSVDRPIAEAPKVEETPLMGAQIRCSLERTAEQAEFHLASEELLFLQAVKEVQSANPELVEAAIWNLRTIENPAATRVLNLLAKEPRAKVRIQALNALTGRGEEGVASLFQHAIKDVSAGVRRAALRGLYRLDPGGRAIPYLTEALRDSDAGVRHRAVMCLTWAGVRSVLPNLLHLLAEDPDALVRRAAVDALGALKSKVAVPGLIQALDDQNARVRRAAHKTLMNLTRRTIIIDPDAPCQDHLGLKTQWEVWWKTAEATLQIDQEGS